LDQLRPSFSTACFLVLARTLERTFLDTLKLALLGSVQAYVCQQGFTMPTEIFVPLLADEKDDVVEVMVDAVEHPTQG
jgi:hypothetical protein